MPAYKNYTILLFATLLFGSAKTSFAQQGTFTAQQDCQATKALRHDNPGNIRIEVGQAYNLLATNKEPPTHYLIDISDAPVTNRRWVSIDCGTVNSDVTSVEKSKKKSDKQKAQADTQVEADSIENVLAASWQPTFCATNRGSSKKECKSLRADHPAATQFSIHGLWPDDLNDKNIFPCYCGKGQAVSCRTKRKAAKDITLSNKLWEQLEELMPGVQSGLHLHEWSKHGTCYEDFISGDDKGADPEEYYAETVSLIKGLNASAVGDLFANNLGKEITLKEVKKSFDKAFGKNAGERVFMNCSRIKGKDFISELWISLGGTIDLSSDIGDLIQSAPSTDSSTSRKPCFEGIVTKVNG